MSVHRLPRLLRGAFLLLALFTVLQFQPAHAQARAPLTADDLAFTQIATVGQDGFTEAFGPQGVARRVTFVGTRNGARTLYLHDDGVFVEVLPADGTLPNGLGTATVTGGAVWRWQQMKVGAGFTTTLRIEDGAFVGDSPAEEMIIGGSGSGLVQNHVARVTVDNASNNPGPLGLGTVLASIINLVVGQELIGELHVTNGGSVFAITATVGALDHGSRTDGTLTVTGGNATRPSTFVVGNDFANNGALFAATGQGSDAQIEITEGGQVQATSLSLASGPQSSALAFVDGVNGQRRSSLFAPLPEANDAGAPNPAAGMCVVGHAGQAALNVSNGGLVECRNLAVGLLSGSLGEINIGAGGSQVIARGTANGDGLACIGGVTACGGPGAGRGAM